MSILGLSIALLCVLIAQLWHGGSLKALLDAPAFFIVFGGTMGAVMVQTPFSIFVESFKQLVWIFVPPKFNVVRHVAKINEWGKTSRRLGFLALEEYYEQEEDEFTKHGLELIIDGADSNQIRFVLESEMSLRQERNELCARFYESMGGYSPTIGILGAVIGLIDAMGHLDDPSKLGVGISIAFVATIYGVGFANLFYIPVANRLRMIHYEASLFQQLTIEGLLSVSNGEGQMELNRRLSIFKMGLPGVKDIEISASEE